MTAQVDIQPSRWDLSNVYPGLTSPEFKQALQNLQENLTRLEDHMKQLAGAPLDDLSAVAAMLGEVIDDFNVCFELSATLRSYIGSFVSTNSFDLTAKRAQSEFEGIRVRLDKLMTRFTSFAGKMRDQIDVLSAANQVVEKHVFILGELARRSEYLMSEPEESLAAELGLSGADAWGKLQGTITSQLSVNFELDGEIHRMPMPALINLHSYPGRDVRKRAYEAELAAWKTVEEPLAAALNGVKGAVSTLNRRRGRQDDLHPALDDARLDRETLETMLDAIRDALPLFHRYFRTKAARFGDQRLAWWDVFAPTGKSSAIYTFADAQAFILDHFERFSPRLSDLASRAFQQHWIDAEQRTGKRGGAFCMSTPAVQESRVMCNFDGTLDQVSTIAHELGHAFHNDCLFRAGRTGLQRVTPMTMAETASIMCETIIFNAVLEQAADPQEELAILETALIGDAQVVVDIYSRYLFETEVFKQRAISELSAQDFCNLMEASQKAAYGDGLDERYLHKYMWTWKPHYYRPGLSFYNFPYTFGLLFGTGLYAIYQQRGDEFVPDYINLLSSTGMDNPVSLAARFGIDIRSKDFWVNSLHVIAKRIDRYTAL